ncbi:helix-turn-helix domain-containing protein [Streptomyces sp. t39]|uniref:helix-turn-helix domain-containing protein n=1 Tax=Streptomyces sp. t39 TaxID=1828156 RepID=UPI0011CDB18B|nr:helix-turn-helix domain-containing protein [Streptomyces sp. t39]TXS51074.1 PucR family transcriptional regulator [Streptomyces sp. t39]
MDSDRYVPPAYGGVPLHQRLAGSLRELTSAVLDRLVDHVPVYGTLPDEQLRNDIRRVVEQAIRSCATVLRTGELPDDAQLQVLRQSAAKRAEEGVPVESVIRAYHVGAQECLERMAPHAGPGDLRAVQEAGLLVLRFLEQMTATVVAGYFTERQAAASEEQSARQAVLAALLDGDDVRTRSAHWGFDLPPCYLVLGLWVGPHPDERADGVSPLIAVKRKRRRLRVELERHVGAPVLSALGAEGGIVLVPRRVPAEGVTEEDWNWLGGVVSHMSRVAGVEIVAGVTAAAPEEVGAAARLVHEIRAVAVASGRGPGVHRLSDVLLEYQLMRPGPARDALAELVRPLADRPELLSTLRTFLQCGLSRQRTAELLRIHPNTVDYRLRRAADATGLDATSGSDVVRVRAALSAHDALFAHDRPG